MVKLFRAFQTARYITKFERKSTPSSIDLFEERVIDCVSWINDQIYSFSTCWRGHGFKFFDVTSVNMKLLYCFGFNFLPLMYWGQRSHVKKMPRQLNNSALLLEQV